MNQIRSLGEILDYFYKFYGKELEKNMSKLLSLVPEYENKNERFDKDVNDEKPCGEENSEIEATDETYHKKFTYTTHYDNVDIEKTTTFKIADSTHYPAEYDKDVFIKIAGEFNSADDIINHINKTLDKELFDLRCTNNNKSEYYNSCEIVYDGVRKEQLNHEKEDIQSCFIDLKYDREKDKFIGNLIVSSNHDREVKMNISYNEFDKYFEPADNDSAKTLMNLLKEDENNMKENVKESEYSCDNWAPEKLDNLKEPNDDCINCKGFKECWMNYDCDEECNDVDCICEDEKQCPVYYEGEECSPCKCSLAEEIYNDINKEVDKDYILDLAINSTLQCINEGLFTPTDVDETTGKYESIAILSDDIREKSNNVLGVSFLSEIDFSEYEKLLKEGCGFTKVYLDSQSVWYAKDVICKLI